MMKNERIDWGLLSAKIRESFTIFEMAQAFKHGEFTWHWDACLQSYSLIGGFKDYANQIASW